MAYIYERFGAVTLPTYNRDSDLAPVPAGGNVVATLAGAFDADGQGRAQPKLPQTIGIKAVVTADTVAAWRTALDQLRAAVGTRAKLYRRGDDASLQVCTARLIAMPHTRSTKNKIHIEVSLQFMQLSTWRGTIYSGPWTLDSGIYLDDTYVFDAASLAVTLGPSGQAIALPNSGNLPVTDVEITVSVTSGTMLAPAAGLSAISFYGNGWFISYNGVINVGQTLIIDTGAQRVTLNGVNAYSSFNLGPAHQIDDWIRLEPGANTVTVVYAGGAGGTVQFEYSDRWA